MKNKSAFTLVELLVVIAIIGIISTLAVVSLTNARKSARDAKRIADIKQIQTALELYYQDNGQYPSTITDSIATSGNIYMQSFPTAPTPADGDCTDTNNAYTYTVLGTENSSYSLTFCLGSQTNDLSAGVKEAIPGGTIDFISPPTPWACGDNLIDSRDNSEYPTVEIGTQCWMKKNLAYLPAVYSLSGFVTQGSSSLPGYGVYGYDDNNVAAAKATSGYSTYRVFYNWYAVNQTNICPTGWSVPTKDQFTTLSQNEEATSSFAILPAGSMTGDGSFYGNGVLAFFWSSSEWQSGYSWYASFSTYDPQFGFQVYARNEGYSIRCIKD